MAIISRGSRWMLLDGDAWELGCFRSEAEALTAAGGYIQGQDARAIILIGSADGHWREEHLGGARH